MTEVRNFLLGYCPVRDLHEKIPGVFEHWFYNLSSAVREDIAKGETLKEDYSCHCSATLEVSGIISVELKGEPESPNGIECKCKITDAKQKEIEKLRAFLIQGRKVIQEFPSEG